MEAQVLWLERRQMETKREEMRNVEWEWSVLLCENGSRERKRVYGKGKRGITIFEFEFFAVELWSDFNSYFNSYFNNLFYYWHFTIF